jgi:hypothetical protein
MPGSPLARKFTDYQNSCSASGRLQLELAHVHPTCRLAWDKMRASGRTDSFIGITDSTTWIFYMAPCAGVDETHPSIQAVRNSAGPGAPYVEAVAAGEFHGDTPVMFGNTASASGAFTRNVLKKSDLEAIYGKNAVCYVLLGPDQYAKSNFDGKSHQACFRWAKRNFGLSSSIYQEHLLGWAVQKDSTGYFLRFASSLNEVWGQGNVVGGVRTGAKTFTPRQPRADRVDIGSLKDWRPHSGVAKEPRDLPKTWALFFERIISRDLVLTLQGGASAFERMTARDEGNTTKLRRFAPT